MSPELNSLLGEYIRTNKTVEELDTAFEGWVVSVLGPSLILVRRDDGTRRVVDFSLPGTQVALQRWDTLKW